MAEMRALYRSVLRAASRYPTRNRSGLLLSIKEEWREPLKAGKPEELARRKAVAKDGLARMRSLSDEGVTLAGPAAGGVK